MTPKMSPCLSANWRSGWRSKDNPTTKEPQMQTDQITDNQLRYLLILAWQRTDADEADIESYRTSFPSMTRLAANDLITTWNAFPQLRANDPPNVGQAVPVTPPVSPPPVNHS